MEGGAGGGDGHAVEGSLLLLPFRVSLLRRRRGEGRGETGKVVFEERGHDARGGTFCRGPGYAARYAPLKAIFGISVRSVRSQTRSQRWSLHSQLAATDEGEPQD